MIAALALACFATQDASPDPKWSEAEVKQRIEKVFAPDERPKIEVTRSKNYIVFTDSSVGPKFAEILDDEVYAGFRKLFAYKPPAPPRAPGATASDASEDKRLMAVYLFKTKEGYWSFCQRYVGWSEKKARDSAGHAWQDYYATSYESPHDSVHFHEGAHQIMSNRLRLGGGGSWFQEGVAEYYQDKIDKVNRAAETRASIRADGATPFRKLFASESLLFEGGTDKRGFATSGGRYGQAASVIQFLKEGPLKDRFDKFFGQIGRAQRNDVPEIEKIVKSVYGLTIEELETRWKDFYAK